MGMGSIKISAINIISRALHIDRMKEPRAGIRADVSAYFFLTHGYNLAGRRRYETTERAWPCGRCPPIYT
jgi:hypothetical protein